MSYFQSKTEKKEFGCCQSNKSILNSQINPFVMPFSFPNSDWLPNFCCFRIVWVIKGGDLTRPRCFCLQRLWQGPGFKANILSFQPTDKQSILVFSLFVAGWGRSHWRILKQLLTGREIIGITSKHWILSLALSRRRYRIHRESGWYCWLFLNPKDFYSRTSTQKYLSSLTRSEEFPSASDQLITLDWEVSGNGPRSW